MFVDHMHVIIAFMCSSGDNLQELVLSFHHMRVLSFLCMSPKSLNSATWIGDKHPASEPYLRLLDCLLNFPHSHPLPLTSSCYATLCSPCLPPLLHSFFIFFPFLSLGKISTVLPFLDILHIDAFTHRLWSAVRQQLNLSAKGKR